MNEDLGTSGQTYGYPVTIIIPAAMRYAAMATFFIVFVYGILSGNDSKWIGGIVGMVLVDIARSLATIKRGLKRGRSQLFDLPKD